MSKEKQIEDIKNVLIKTHKRVRSSQDDYMQDRYAEALYNAGYRKQSEGEWIKKDGLLVCSECDATKPIAFSTVLKITYYKCDYCNRCGAKMKGGAE